MNVKYVLNLMVEERAWLEEMVRKGKTAAWKIRLANALLKMDRSEDGAGWHDRRIAEAFGMTTRSLETWRKRAVEEGPHALFERQYPVRPHRRKLDGAGEAQLVKLACSQAPGDAPGWTLNLLAGKLVELKVVDSVSRETVRRTLKKTSSSRG